MSFEDKLKCICSLILDQDDGTLFNKLYLRILEIEQKKAVQVRHKPT